MIEESNIFGTRRVEILNDEIVVTDPAKRFSWSSLLPLILLVYLVYRFFEIWALLRRSLHERTDLLNLWWPAFLGVLYLYIIFQIVVLVFGKQDIVRCNRQGLNFRHFKFGRLWKIRTMNMSEIRSVSYGAVAISKYGTTSGLCFEGDKQTIKIFPSLGAHGAQVLLKKLQTLGFPTVTDPAMTMQLEIESSRKHRKLGIFRK